jgi:DNA-nicking Smr family endonuclease
MSGREKRESNGPMSRLGELVQKAGFYLHPSKDPAPSAASASKQPDPAPPEVPQEATDDETFMQAMDGVDRLSWRHDPCPSSPPARPPGPDRELEDRRLMQEAINGDSPITILDHPEYIEGWIGVAGKRFLPNLRNGLYSIQGQIDLHGLNRAEAQAAAEEYIARMSRFRSCCVKIIHGRGINSPADRATLKETIQRLLSMRKMSRYVVAYASAPSRDGGVGAVYVLLKKQSPVSSRQ